MTARISDTRAFLVDLFRLAVDVADPMRVVPPHLPPRPKGRLIVIGAGKASARMADAGFGKSRTVITVSPGQVFQ